MLALRSTLFNILFYVNLLILLVFGLPTLLMGRHAIMWLSSLWGRSSLWLLRVICGIKVEVRGRENIPSGSLIVASKHQSFWEVFVLPTIFPDFTFVLKQELTKIPLFGLYLSRSEQIAIDRAKGRAALMQVSRKASDVLAAGRQLLIFPEGTRRPPGAAARYKFGVAFIYEQTGARCLPVALNSGLVWPRRSFLRPSGTVVLEFLPAIEPGLTRVKFLRELEASIEVASDRLLREAGGPTTAVP